MNSSIKGTVLAVALAGVSGWTLGYAEETGDSDKVVYHVNEGLEQASNALRNVRNHLEVDPQAKIKVVTHAKGIDFLIEGAEDKNGNPYNVAVEQLALQGVEFNVCAITLRSRGVGPEILIPEAEVVPSGVGEVTRLQAREGYVYLKP